MYASAISLLQYVVSVELYEEIPASHIYVVGERIILIAFQIVYFIFNDGHVY